jgi:copper chaperone CopZ
LYESKQAGVLSAFLASICCVGPLLLIAVGLGAGAAVIGRYRWLFLFGGGALLAWAWAKYLHEKHICDCERKPIEGRRSAMFTLFAATLIVLGFAGLDVSRYVFASETVPAQAQTKLANGFKRIVIPVEGMSCATCEIGIRYALKSVNGVESARVSAAAKTATVEYDPAKTNPERLVARINSTGYRATLPPETSTTTTKTRQPNGSEEAKTSMDRISVFNASLQCPAAPQIGCGTASKPILLQLEREPAVAEAWLNRAGTQIAIVWKLESNVAARRNVAAKLTDDAKEVQGTPRDEAVRDFLSGEGWYHGADVDRLSEEEAGIIAARLIRRVETNTPLPKEKAQDFQRDLAESWSKCVTGGKHVTTNLSEQPTCRFEDIGEDIARKYLKHEQLKFWKEAIERGVRPLPDEG